MLLVFMGLPSIHPIAQKTLLAGFWRGFCGGIGFLYVALSWLCGMCNVQLQGLCSRECRIAINGGRLMGACFVCEFFSSNGWNMSGG